MSIYGIERTALQVLNHQIISLGNQLSVVCQTKPINFFSKHDIKYSKFTFNVYGYSDLNGSIFLNKIKLIQIQSYITLDILFCVIKDPFFILYGKAKG